MPFSQSVVEWPATLDHLLKEAQMTLGSQPYCRIDVDVDRETLLLIQEFEVHVRHRPVWLKSASAARTVVGEMNELIGLGAPADPKRHIGKVRISFNNLQHEDGRETIATTAKASNM
jgi:hypothetical protein